MRSILLIGVNYLREQRWVVLSLALYPPGMLVLLRGFAGNMNEGDFNAFLQQQAFFSIIFALVFSAAAIHQDRRSRRILGILSKSVRRSQYIAGLLLGVWLFIFIYATSGFVALSLMSAVSIAPGFRMIVNAYVGAMAASCMTMFFTTFLPPFFATVAVGIVLGMPAILQVFRVAHPEWLFPVFTIMREITLSQNHELRSEILLAALLTAFVFWMLASLVFSYRDIAVAIE